MNDLSLYINAALAPIITGLTEAVKQVGLPAKYAPIVNIIFGIGLTFLLSAESSVGANIVLGIGTGLAAGGLYSGTKKMLN